MMIVNSLERDIKLFEKNGGYDWKQNIYEALLKEAIDIDEVRNLRFLTERMFVHLLKDVDTYRMANLEVSLSEKWHNTELGENLSSPFITENPAQLEILLGANCSRQSQRIAWEDGEKLYFMDATPMAAALASGNLMVFEYFLENYGWTGFYNDAENESDWGFSYNPKKDMYDVLVDDFFGETPCRLWSPEEAALLSGDVYIIRKIFENQSRSELIERLGSKAVEYDGKFYYKKILGTYFPDALYWLNEEASLYVNQNYPELHWYYQLDKIIDSANYVLLATYLADHGGMRESMIQSLIQRVSQLELPRITFGMLEEKSKLAGVHCVPISENWLEHRKHLCIETLKAYLLGRKAYVAKKDVDIESDLYKRTDDGFALGWDSWSKVLPEQESSETEDFDDWDYDDWDYDDEINDFDGEGDDDDDDDDDWDYDDADDDENGWAAYQEFFDEEDE